MSKFSHFAAFAASSTIGMGYRAFVITRLLAMFTPFRLGVVETMGLLLILSIATFKTLPAIVVSKEAEGISRWQIFNTSLVASTAAWVMGYVISLFL